MGPTEPRRASEKEENTESGDDIMKFPDLPPAFDSPLRTNFAVYSSQCSHAARWTSLTEGYLVTNAIDTAYKRSRALTERVDCIFRARAFSGSMSLPRQKGIRTLE